MLTHLTKTRPILLKLKNKKAIQDVENERRIVLTNNSFKRVSKVLGSETAKEASFIAGRSS